MTPLAMAFAKQLTLPVKDRELECDMAGLASRMSDVHCFDVTAVQPMIEDLTDQLLDAYRKTGKLKTCELAFVPAPKTWIEYRRPSGVRDGYLLLSDDSCRADARVLRAMNVRPRIDKMTERALRGENPFDYVGPGKDPWPEGAVLGLQSLPFGVLPLLNDRPAITTDTELDRVFQKFGAGKGSDGTAFLAIQQANETQIYNNIWLYAALAIINTPRLIGRQTHQPHRGLEKALLAQRKVIGSFPLHAWTEIKLEINAPKDATGDPAMEGHLTGEKCLHFCRAHLRIRIGQLEIVRAHWRGDAALGIKQSRYGVVPPRH